MKANIISFTLCILLGVFGHSARAQEPNNNPNQLVMPLKTVVIKDPRAEKLDAFLAETKVLKFSVYKLGTMRDVEMLTKNMRRAEDVESFMVGPVTGDFSEFTITLKNPKNLDWYKKTFKSVGFTNLKVNAGEVKPL